MKILLLSPNIKGVKGGINRIQPPLGLAYISSYLKQNNQEVIVRDTAIEGYDNITDIDSKMCLIGESIENIRTFLSLNNPDIIGISVLFANLMDSVHQVSNIAKQINPNVVICVGGNHITNVIRDYQNNIDDLKNITNTNIDYYFIGESEKTFCDFVLKKELSGVCFWNKDRFVINENKNGFLNVSELLKPDWESFNMEKYFSVGLFHSAQSYSNRVLPVMASRGCPEKCQFCTTPLTWGSKVRWNNVKRIYEEIKFGVEKFKIGEIQFQDDTLTANLKHLYELCISLEEFKLPWCTPNGIKINYHQKNQFEMFSKMKKSGCYQTTFACESGSQRVLDEIVMKNIKAESFKENIQKAKDSGLFVHTFWIVGFPGETRKEMELTIEKASESNADSFSLAIFNPLPGTPLYHKVKKENRWWNPEHNILNMTFRNSLIKVDGFDSPEEFEFWVDKQNSYLNSILENSDIERYNNVRKNRGVMLRKDSNKIKQT